MSERRKKTNFIRQGGVRALFAWPVLLLFCLKMIYLASHNGMMGLQYYAMAGCFFFIFYAALVYSVTPVMKKMVYFQVNKGSYRNAAKVYRSVSICMIVIAAVIALLLFGFSSRISLLLFGTKLCSLLLRLFAVSLVFYTGMACIRGYLEGMGNPMPGMTAEIIASLASLLVTVLLQSLCSDYGGKVADLIRVDSYDYAYSVSCGAAGCLAGSICGFLFLVLILAVFRNVLREREHADDTRMTEKRKDILRNFVSILLAKAPETLFAPVLLGTMMILYCHTPGRTEDGAGILYAGLYLLSVPVILIARQLGQPFSRQLTVILKRADYHHARERICVHVKVLLYMLCPYLIVLLCLAAGVSALFFDTENVQLIHMIRFGVPALLFAGFAVLFTHIAEVVLGQSVRNGMAVAAYLIGTGCFFLYGKASVSPEESALFAIMAGWGAYFIVQAVLLFRKIRFLSERFFSCLGFLTAAFGMSLVLILFSVLLYGKMPNWIFMLLAVGIGYVCYNVVVVVLRLFEPYEWKMIPGALFPVFLAKKLNRYS